MTTLFTFFQKKIVGLLLFGLVSALMLVYIIYLQKIILTESAAHEKTRSLLEQANRDLEKWGAAAEQLGKQNKALQASVNDCLGREKKAQKDAMQRNEVLRSVFPAQSKQDKKDGKENFRKKLANRLNRGL